MNQVELKPEHIISRAEGNLASNMDGETVMMSISKGKYYNLGQVGGQIWAKLDQPISVDQLVAALVAEYEIEAEACMQEVFPFLTHLAKEGLIKYT